MGVLRQLSRGLKYGGLLTVLGGSVAVLHKNQWDVASMGLVRFGRAAWTIAVVSLDYKRTMIGIEPGCSEYALIRSKLHLRSAERLRAMCCVNGGCFIKVGQHLGSLDYILPTEYVRTMQVLHTDAPKTHVAKLHQVIKEDLGHEVEELFMSFDDEPLGSASLAQAHRATLHDGTEVAVKVQHPHVKGHAFVDMATMEFLVRGVAWLFPEFQFMWLAEETKKNLPVELDFVNEGHNCERIGKMLSHLSFLKIPAIHWSLTSDRVLTMELCSGGQINDVGYRQKNNISANEVSEMIGELYSEMIFIQGCIHCDPHPGNILVEKVDNETKIVLLDHGLYQVDMGSA